MNRPIAVFTISLLLAFALAGCRHPLVIVGKGDIVELTGSGRGCSLEQYTARDAACVENEVTGDYFVNYEARPRPGWRFVRWQGPCARDSDFGHCRLHVTADAVQQWDESDQQADAPRSTAVFQPVSGETGYLLAGNPVAGVTYTTPTQEGVTGLDGSFQYSEGERVTFAIGATRLGEVAGKARVTPFDLAGSPILQGAKIAWALRDENNPLNSVINLAVLLQSLDRDGTPGNGIVITRGVSELLAQVKLELHQRVDEFSGYSDAEGGSKLVAQDWEGFRADPGFRHVLGRANRGHRFSLPHGVAGPGVAMARLYRALSIDPRIVGLEYLQIRNEDGEYWERFAYDNGGYLVQHEISAFGGAYETWQYNARGQVTLHEQHAEEMNHHLTSSSAYDSRGNWTHTETRFGGNETQSANHQDIDNRYDKDSNLIGAESVRASEDGTETDISVYSYRYDNRGRLAQFVADGEQHYADGSNFNSVEYFDYGHDSNGNLRRYSLARDVNDVDGVPEQYWVSWYDESGRVTRHRSTFDFAPDQEEPAQMEWIWKYDASGKVRRFGTSDGAWLFRYQYDANGNTTRRELVSASSGEVSEVVTWQYDEAGRVVLKEHSKLAPYPITTLSGDKGSESWQYSASGGVSLYTSEEISQLAGFGEPFEYSVNREYRFDASGNLIRYRSQNQFADSRSEEVYSWQYDVAGNLTREEMDNDSGGRYVHSWVYDDNRNPTRFELDQDGDGIVDETTEFRYAETGWGYLFAGVAPFGANLPLPSEPGESFEYIPPPQPPSSQ